MATPEVEDDTTVRTRRRGLARFLREAYMPVPEDVRVVSGGRRVVLGATLFLLGLGFYSAMAITYGWRGWGVAASWVAVHLLLVAAVLGSSRVGRWLAIVYGVTTAPVFLKGLVQLLVLLSYMQPFPPQVHLALTGGFGGMTLGIWFMAVDRDARAWHAAQRARRASRRARATSLAAWRRAR